MIIHHTSLNISRFLTEVEMNNIISLKNIAINDRDKFYTKKHTILKTHLDIKICRIKFNAPITSNLDYRHLPLS